MKKKSILVVSHDAGGANILSSYIKKKQDRYIFFLKGPAIKIFKEKLNFKNNKKFDNFKLIKKIYTSSSWESKHEVLQIDKANKLNIPTTLFLDHWVNYKNRLNLGKKKITPSEIIASDKYAYSLAKKIFTKTKIKKAKNYYLAEGLSKLRKLKYKINKNSILYLTEPIKPTKLKLKQSVGTINEFTLLKNFIKFINKYEKVKLTIRLHPQEKINKYDNILKMLKTDYAISKNNSLTKDLAKNKVIIGADTYAMVFGLESKKQVFTSLPKGHNYTLPYKEIKRISELEKIL